MCNIYIRGPIPRIPNSFTYRSRDTEREVGMQEGRWRYRKGGGDTGREVGIQEGRWGYRKGGRDTGREMGIQEGR